MRLSVTLARLAPLTLLGCSLLATSEPEQCANDNDCYVKFGAQYACQAGGCVPSAAATPTRRVVSTLEDCRSTQECVASFGEGWLCRRNRDDPQKRGKCQQLTATTECRLYGDYKNDQAVLLGALVPGKDGPFYAASVRAGIARAVSDWEIAIQQLQQTNIGPDAVAPPRPFAVLACTEDVPRSDLRNLFLNSGVPLVVGPAALGAQTEPLASELTTARLVLLSPTSVAVPKEGTNVGTFFFRAAAGGADVHALHRQRDRLQLTDRGRSGRDVVHARRIGVEAARLDDRGLPRGVER